MTADSFYRRASGLLLPRASLAPMEILWQLGTDCCDGATTWACTACSCSISSSGYAPCCLKVVIAGIADNTCADCGDLNKTYYAGQEDDEDAGTPAGCSWADSRVCGDCAPADDGDGKLWVTAYQDGSDYIVEVTLGAHVWKKNYGETKPDLCGLSDESLPHDTNSGDCDSSSATCVITAQSDFAGCASEPCYYTCATCSDDMPELAVDLSGMSVTNNNCELCDTLDDIYVLENVNPCSWLYTEENFCLATACWDAWPIPDPVWLDLHIIAQVKSLAPAYRWQVKLILTKDTLAGPVIPYMSATWTWLSLLWGSDETCFEHADGEGKVELSGGTLVDYCYNAYGQGNGDICDGNGPATIDIWDASA